jgi:hypothetical protein
VNQWLGLMGVQCRTRCEDLEACDPKSLYTHNSTSLFYSLSDGEDGRVRDSGPKAPAPPPSRSRQNLSTCHQNT